MFNFLKKNKEEKIKIGDKIIVIEEAEKEKNPHFLYMNLAENRRYRKNTIWTALFLGSEIYLKENGTIPFKQVRKATDAEVRKFGNKNKETEYYKKHGKI
jgi:hypothetical protein